MSEQKYYRTVFTYEVLSDRPIGHLDFEDVVQEAIEGEFSGEVKEEKAEVVDAKRMRKLLEEQGSDPDFLMGDEDDEDE